MSCQSTGCWSHLLRASVNHQLRIKLRALVQQAKVSSDIPPYREELAHPTVSEMAISKMKALGSVEDYPAGHVIYQPGQGLVDLYLVLEGQIEHFAFTLDKREVLAFTLQPGEFSGEMDLVLGHRSLLGLRSSSLSRLLRVPRHNLKELLKTESDFANLVMQAAIWRRLRLAEKATAGVMLVGRNDSPHTLQLRSFLARNRYPHLLLTEKDHSPVDLPEGSTLPFVLLQDGRLLEAPTIPELADELEISQLPMPDRLYDVVVVGAGPAGLAAAVYAASEGLSVVLIESLAAGGQAGTSSKIENYLGFPTGISGVGLAHRAYMQALKFGVRLSVSRRCEAMVRTEGAYRLCLSGAINVQARTVVVATGAMYRTLKANNFRAFENRGIYYAATAMECALCAEKEVIVFGGGNSAGQAAVYLSGRAKHVHLVIRAKSLDSTMSQYLISRIEGSASITLHSQTIVESFEGAEVLESVTLRNQHSHELTEYRVGSVFVMIGAIPNTEWMQGTVELDEKGFVLTGHGKAFESSRYATNLPGVYAIGDVRSGSVKRVASAVGEGSVVVSDVHRYLSTFE